MRLAPLLVLALAAASARAEEAVVALWAPAESFTDWTAVSQTFDAYPALRLTIALTPQMAGRRTEVLLARWVEAGRLELAARIKGDPVLPLIALAGPAPRPEDVVNRLAVTRERFRLTFGSAPPAGFVPGGGAFDPRLLPAFEAVGLRWAAAGGDAPLLCGPAPAIVSFSLADPAAPPRDLLAPAAAPWVIDEASGASPQGLMAAQLAWLAEERPRRRWLTVSEALALAPAAQEETAQASSWSEGLFQGGAEQDAAWEAYHQAAAALRRYQNSGSADLKALEAATEALYGAQSGALYRALADPVQAEAAKRKLRALLVTVYKKMKVPVPGALFQAAEPGQAEERSPDITVSQTASSLTFENAKGPKAGALKSAALSWSPEELVFSYRLAPGSLEDLRLDTYIDLNGQPGAGSTALLEGRGAYAHNRDAWEYALAVEPPGARLYRSSPGGPPVEIGRGTLTLDGAAGSVRVAVPRTKLPGNPLRWGYIVFTLAPGGSVPASVLAPLDFQKAAAEGGRRLSAVRAR